jgi:hypothetical protein
MFCYGNRLDRCGELGVYLSEQLTVILVYRMFLLLQVEPMETEENIDLNEEDQVRKLKVTLKKNYILILTQSSRKTLTHKPFGLLEL